MGEKLKKSDCTRIISLEEMELFYQAYLDRSIKLKDEDLDIDLNSTLNARRYFELINSIQIQQKIYNFFSELKDAYVWYIIADMTSTDIAYALPVMNALASSADNIQLQILPEDDNKNLASRFLNNATVSVPKLICVEKVTEEIVFIWEPMSKLLHPRDEETEAGQAIQQEIYEKFKQALNNKSIIQDIQH